MIAPSHRDIDAVPDAPRDAAFAPFASPAEGVAGALGVDVRAGLSSTEAAARLSSVGRNELEPPQKTSIIESIVDSATEPFVVVLAISGLLALLLGEVRDGLLVLVGLIPIVGADVITEFRAERAMEALRDAAAPHARIRRNGAVADIPAGELVPGDVVLLRVGDIVPADLRLSRVESLTINSSILTGESMPVEATTAPDLPDAVLADRRSMAYSGTSIVLGRGEGIVIATGHLTEFGRIAAALGPAGRGRSPLQRELDRLVRILVIVAAGLIVVAVGANLLRGATLGAAVLAGISAAIAAIPEEPPVLLAVILGLGAFRLLRRDVLVRRLNAQETLGAVDLIITDKTGTLTENRLALTGVETPSGPVADPTERARLVGDSVRAEDDAWSIERAGFGGSFTRALIAEAGGLELLGLDPANLVAAEGPRDGRPWSSTRANRNGVVEDLAIGAPEAVLALADEPGLDRGPWQLLVQRRAGEGGRLVLLARRLTGRPWRPEALLTFADPMRPEIPAAIEVATGAGIQTIVVTGDHPVTAVAIARAAGVAGQVVLTGTDLERMTDEEIDAVLPKVGVVARATPDHKLRLVRLARATGRTVAVTGDGVNDAPALNSADVGVAMGSGTAVAREAADLVLGDDSFVTLLNGLAEGRRILANVEKGLVFLTSTHVALLGFLFIATLAGFGQPLLPIQILWLELFIDLSTSVAFERDPAEPGLMQRPPRPRSIPLLTAGLLGRVTLAGGFTAVSALLVMEAHGGGADHARWLAFNILVIGQLVRAYANRSLTQSVLRLPPNTFLLLSCLTVAVIQLVIPVVPALQEAFRATRLDATDLVIIAIVALVPAIVADLVRRRGRLWVA